MVDSRRRDFLIQGAALGAAAALPGCTDAPHIPAPRPVPWKMKGLASAKTRFEVLPDGRLFLGIRHDVLRGITPAMLVWWFQNLEGDLTVGGRTWPRYLVWHPVDHIAIRYARRLPDGSVGPGARIHIQEAFGGRPEYFVNVVSTIEKLDETGFVHVPRIAGVDLARMEYTFTPVKGGTLYENSMTVGPATPLARPLFNQVRPHVYPDDKARAWLLHNIEEVGNFEHFLPALDARSVKPEPGRAG